MTTLRFSYEHAGVSPQHIEAGAHKLSASVERLGLVVEEGGYTKPEASLNLLDDSAMFAAVTELAKQFANADCVIIVGIGGSNLGTKAIHEAIFGQLNNMVRTPALFFADTVDAATVGTIASIASHCAANRKRLLLNVISKSGSTTETAANAAILIDAVQKHGDPRTSVVVTTDEGSTLWHVAAEQEYAALSVPKNVGGRYSVLSAVGLFPLAVLGVDIRELVRGALVMRDRCLISDWKLNPAIIAASILHHHYQRHRTIHEFFAFATDLESLGKWERQLVGESLGKERAKKDYVGITPTVCIGSTDLHSVGQLAFGGPRDKVTTFVSYDSGPQIHIPASSAVGNIVPHLGGRDLHTVMTAISDAAQAAYAKQELPYMSIRLASASAEAIGEFLQLRMMTVMYLADLLGVNAFDQPAVEHYKDEARRILSHLP